MIGVQVTPHPYDVDTTFKKFAREARRLASSFPAFDLYVFPKLYLSTLGSFEDDRPPGYEARVAETIPSPLTAKISDVARNLRKWIIAGSIYERDGDTFYNTALIMSPTGELVTTYRKLFP